MRLQNMTPAHLRCSVGGCPAVYKKEDGTYLIVGKKADSSTSAALSGKVADDEFLVEIAPEFLAHILPLTTEEDT